MQCLKKYVKVKEKTGVKKIKRKKNRSPCGQKQINYMLLLIYNNNLLKICTKINCVNKKPQIKSKLTIQSSKIKKNLQIFC